MSRCVPSRAILPTSEIGAVVPQPMCFEAGERIVSLVLNRSELPRNGDRLTFNIAVVVGGSVVADYSPEVLSVLRVADSELETGNGPIRN